MVEKKKARYYRDKHVVDALGGVEKFESLDKPDKISTGVSKENLELMKNEVNEKEVEETREKLSIAYQNINSIIRKYCDLKEDYYPLIAIWIIGTYLHDEFSSYAYLFLNAMHGSGKTRLLKLIATLSKNGKLMVDLRESVLFRTAKGSTICLDEFENVASKDKATLRELLNAGYKKGMKVERMKKVTGKGGETFEVESFDLYTSIAMANIWGMDEVLEDRCISLTLERSNDRIKTRLIEDFEDNEAILHTKSILDKISVSLCRVVPLKNITKEWNLYLHDVSLNDTTTHTTTTTHNDNTTLLHLNPERRQLFRMMFESDIDGRNIELLYPLFIISQFLDWKLFKEILRIGTEMVDKKKGDKFIESRDVALYDFISHMPVSVDFTPIVDITRDFKEYVGATDDDDKWVNTKWLGQALKRLNLVKSKKRVARGREVVLDINKAMEKIKLFKVAEEPKDI